MSKEESRSPEKKGSWLTYRPDIKVLDCTIRDGGLMNNSRFEDDFVRAVYKTCVAAGVDYMELGYKGSKRIYSPQEFGPWKFSTRTTSAASSATTSRRLKLSVMADVERTDYHEDILPKEQSVAGHDPRGDLHPPDPRRGRHDQGRPRQGLRDHAST